MKSAWFSAALLVLLCAPLRGEPASIKFDGGTYLLAKVSISPDGIVTNDYVKEGESIENWTTLLSVQLLTKTSSLNDAINGWLQSNRPRLTKKWVAAHTPNALRDADVVVEAWMANRPEPRVHATLQRFVAEDDAQGVKVYRFIEKLDPAAEQAESFAAKKKARSLSLAELKMPTMSETTALVAAK